MCGESYIYTRKEALRIHTAWFTCSVIDREAEKKSVTVNWGENNP